MPLPIHAESGSPEPHGRIDWEAFYRDFRKPGYVPGFEIVTKLGGGMFGQVYKARKESIGKDYAIKFLKVDDESVRDAVARELESVRHFAQLDHPNLVSIEDMGEVDGIPYLIMSYAGQETLRTRLSQGAMARDDAMRIFVQAARGVQALHERSLVHFDIKPANIFLKGDVARVGDFGLSKLVTESRNSLSFGRGTPYYMAPEMLHRRGDSKSDIYSLGVLLYECLCGRVPFTGESEWEVLKKHEQEAPAFPAQVSAADRRVVERCMAKDPAQRYESVADLLRELDAPVSLGESVLLRMPDDGEVDPPSDVWDATVPRTFVPATFMDAFRVSCEKRFSLTADLPAFGIVKKTAMTAAKQALGMLAHTDVTVAVLKDSVRTVGDVVASVTLTMWKGTAAVDIELRCSPDTARSTAASLLGIDEASAAPEDACSAVGELINIVAGRIQVAVAGEYGPARFTLPKISLDEKPSTERVQLALRATASASSATFDLLMRARAVKLRSAA